MSVALLQDVSRCIGCRGCQVSCKQWNDLGAERTRNRGSPENPARLSSRTRTRIRFREHGEPGRLRWTFTKVQCMHCLEPACVAVCTVGALQRSAEGAVVQDPDLCIGCRYCQYACPFGIPAFEWDAALARVDKCGLCIDRIRAGLEPACAKTCPADAIEFGEREALLAEARRRIAAHPGRYVPRVYGEREAGGTSVLYLSPVPFRDLDLPDLPHEPPARASDAVMRATPFAAVGIAALLGGLCWIARRREAVAAAKEDAAGKGDGA